MTGTLNAESTVFDDWLTRAAEAQPEARNDALAHWDCAPAARLAHPNEEHLMPLMVAAGAAGADIGTRAYSEIMGGKALSGFAFGR